MMNRKIKIQKMFSKVLVLVCVLQLMVPPTPLFAGSSNPRNPNPQNLTQQSGDSQVPNIAELASVLVSLSEGERAQLAELQSLEGSVEALDGQGGAVLSEVPTRDFHLLGQQKVEFLRSANIVNTVVLAEVHPSLPAVAYTKLNVRYDSEAKELIFEGSRGENDKGEHGEVVVRQTIGGVDIKAMAYDKELLVFVDSKGQLDAINFQYVKAAVFKAAIPVFTRLWAPLEPIDLSQQEVQVEFIRRSSRPIDPQSLPKSTVLPLAENGEVILTAGDVVVTYGPKGGPQGDTSAKPNYLGLFSRATIAEDIHRTSQFAYEVGVLSMADESMIQKMVDSLEKKEADRTRFDEYVARIFEKKGENRVEFEKYIVEMSPIERKALAALTPEALGSLFITGKFVQDPSAIKGSLEDKYNGSLEDKHKRKNLKDQYTVSENRQWFEQALAKLKAQYPDQQNNPNNQSQPDQPAKQINAPINDPTRTSKILNASAKFLGDWRTLTFLGVGYLAFPVAYENFEILSQIKILSWSYHHLFTDVMKDAAYRWTNTKSIVQLLALIPAAMLSSASIGWLLKRSSKALQNSKTLAAQRIRDLAGVWGDMGVWERIITFSNRYYSVWIYPVLRIMLSHGLRQKGLFTGWSNGFIHPLEKVKVDSEVGRKLGLTKDEFVLWNNPLEASVSLAKYLEPLGIRLSPRMYELTDGKAIQVAQRKEHIQTLLREQQQRYRKIAWAYATLVVAEHGGVDPATLAMATDSGKNILEMENILKDPTKEKQWELVANDLYQRLREADLLKDGLNEQLDVKVLQDFVQKHRQTIEAKYLKNGGQASALFFARLKMKFRLLGLKAFRGAANFSMDEVNVLRNAIPNAALFDMIKREFVLDHIQVVGLPALVGERADLRHPEELAAKEGGPLDTNPRHMYDVAYNTYAHLFVSGAVNTLTYYKYRPSRESAYDPQEYETQAIQERAEGLMHSTLQFFRYLLPDKSDIGGVMLRDLKRRVATIQSAIYSAVFMRGMIYGASAATVTHMFGFQFFSAIWWWGLIWYPMQLGTQLTDDRVGEVKTEVMENIRDISRALRGIEGSSSPEYLKESYERLLRSYAKYSPELLKQVFALTEYKYPSSFFKSAEDKYLEMGNEDWLIESFVNEQKGMFEERVDKAKEHLSAEVDNSSSFKKTSAYFGLLIRLAYAIKNKNSDEASEIRSKIVQVQTGELTSEELILIKKLSAESLLEFAVQNPPRSSLPHPLVPWMATQTAVFLSTYLAISWSVVMMNEAKLMDPMLIPKWMAIWAGGYLSAYLFFRKAPYDKAVAKVTSTYQETKQRWQNWRDPKSNEGRGSEVNNGWGGAGVKCSQIFVRPLAK